MWAWFAQRPSGWRHNIRVKQNVSWYNFWRVAGFQLSSCDAVARDAVELIPSGTYAGGSISQCSFAYRLRLGRPRCDARWGLSVSAS